MSTANKQLLDAAKKVLEKLEGKSFVCNDLRDDLRVAIAAAEQAQQITDNTRVAWTSLGTVKAMLPELLASDDVKVRENAQIIDALVKLVGNQQAQQAEPVAADPAVAAIQFALETHSDGLHFLRLWNEGEFELLRREWPEAPEEIYIGADPLIEVPAQPPAVAVAVSVPDGWSQQVFELCNDIMGHFPMTEAMMACMYKSTGDRGKYPNAADWLASAALAAAQKGGDHD